MDVSVLELWGLLSIRLISRARMLLMLLLQGLLERFCPNLRVVHILSAGILHFVNIFLCKAYALVRVLRVLFAKRFVVVFV